MSDDQAEHAESVKEQHEMLIGNWVKRARTAGAIAMALVDRCREMRSELEAIQAPVLHYRHGMRMWQEKDRAVREEQDTASRISNELIRLQGEWGTLPLPTGYDPRMQNILDLVRESRSEMMTELVLLKSDLTNIHQTLIGDLGSYLARVSIALGALSVAITLVMYFVVG